MPFALKFYRVPLINIPEDAEEKRKSYILDTAVAPDRFAVENNNRGIISYGLVFIRPTNNKSVFFSLKIACSQRVYEVGPLLSLFFPSILPYFRLF